MLKKIVLASLFFLACLSASAKMAPSPHTVKTTHVTCASTATLVVPELIGRYHPITIEQFGTTQIFLGDANVTTANGFPIPGNLNTSYTFVTSTNIYCITASGTDVVAVIEGY